ncbi:hypothetical protein [Nesterenkonia muleiensis]
MPAVIAGAVLGRWIADRIARRVFDRLVIGCTILGALYLFM